MKDLASAVSALTPEQRAVLELRLQSRQAGRRRAEALPRRRAPGPQPLSFAQQRLWFLEQLAPGSPAYLIPAAVRLRGDLAVAALERSLAEILRRHEVLRAAFAEADGGPVQIDGAMPEPLLPLVDLAALPPEGRAPAEALRLAAAEAMRPFALGRGGLLRSTLLRLGGAHHVLLFTMHHIAADGWSLGVLLAELSALYGAGRRGAPSPLPELPIQYADYSLWQRERLRGELLETQLAYWRQRLAGAPARLDLPADWPRPAVQSQHGAAEAASLDGALLAELKALAGRHQATLFMVLVAAFALLLARFSGQEDVLLGTPVANRERAELEGLIGFFANTVVLRADLGGDPSVTAHLERVREAAVEAFSHQELPFEKLVEELAPERDLSHSPLFQVMFAWQNAPLPALELPGLALEPLPPAYRSAKFDLLLTLEERNGAVTGVLEYRTELFAAVSVRRLLSHFRTLLDAMSRDRAARVWDLPMLDAAERCQVLQEWNDTHQAYPRDVCLHQLLELQVARTPRAVALVCGGERLTYRELDARANRLAHRLRAAGVGPDVPVAVCLERSVEMVVGLIATLKAGGAYLPVDPAYPRERVAYMLESSMARVVLSRRADQPLVARLGGTAARVVLVDGGGPPAGGNGHERAPGRLESLTQPLNLAYVMYTSGSTGRPKGVMISHGAICNHMFWMQAARPLAAGDGVLQKTPFSFDASVWEFWAPLLAGARLVIARPGGHQDPAYLAEEIRGQGVTILQVVPTLLRLFLQEPAAPGCRSLRRIYCGGEALPAELAERCLAVLPGAELLNVYGPTEAAIHATFWGSSGGRVDHAVPIGRPIGNAQAYLLDRGFAPVPVGVPGMLYVGGEGLGRGYLGRPRLTAERFIPHPFAEEPGLRLYSTGDLARYLRDGGIEFLGRVDHQVKVRGFRVEPGEIESVLAAHPLVEEAAVVARPDASGVHQLAAYVVAAAGARRAAAELRAWLKERLPEYMVPARVVYLAAFPLMPNGKLDRRALPAPQGPREDLDAGTVAARSAGEELLAALWCEVLGLERVGMDDNFFDLGGHSLLATRLISRLRQACGVELPLRSLFEAPTVRELARRIAAEERTQLGLELPPLLPLPRDGAALPLSFAQERLWFLDQLEPGNAAYHLPAAVRFGGALEVPALLRAFAAVVERHEVFRTRFPMVEGRPVQAFSAPAASSSGGAQVAAAPAAVDLAGLPAERREAAARQLIGAAGRRPFDLARGPAWRALLLRLGEREHVLSLTVHHIIYDGWSTAVLVREMAALYAAYAAGRPSPLRPLPLQFADFAHWQRQWLRGRLLETQLAYWRGQLRGAPPLLALPGDRPRPAAQTYRGAHREVRLPGPLVRAVSTLGRREGATQFMVLLAAFTAVLERHSGQSDLCLGSPIANRACVESEELIGCFANTLVLRADLSGNPTGRELLRRTRETSLGAYAHQDLPLELLVDALELRRDLSYSPLFQVLFGLQNAPAAPLELPGLEVAPFAAGGGSARFDLACDLAAAGGDEMSGWLEYSTDLFDASTVVRFAGHFAALLGGLTADPDSRLADLPWLGEAERHQLLWAWNDTALPQGEELPISRLIEAQAARTPAALALACSGERVTYGQLNRRANQLARHLRTRGVGPEVVVGVCLSRSVEMVVALLGILKAGGAYLPLDPSYPPERLAFMLADSAAPLLVSEERWAGRFADFAGETLDLAGAAAVLARQDGEDLDTAPPGAALAYVIYTSGSTGRPKGVMVAQRNVASFFRGMDGRLRPGEAAGTWLAVTSISFDISVLELFWTLARGFAVVLHEEAGVPAGQPSADGRAAGVAREGHEMAFSLFYFASDEEEVAADRYRLLLAGARHADRHGYAAVWTPERHFHAFGGLYPNPAVTSAAVAALTERVEIRAGSVVLPLHNPIRVAEEWAVVDNLSRGRVGISFASGWHADDFVLAPDNYARRKEVMFEGIDLVRRLWRGDAAHLPGPGGRAVQVRIRPRPVRRELPVWVTAAGSPETFRLAGEIGANVLTHLLGQSIEELAAMIAVYRAARQSCAGLPGPGHVTLMLHTFVGEDMAAVRAAVHAPFRNYLRSSLSLLKGLAKSLGQDVDAAGFSADDMEALLDHAGERYFASGSLFGTPDVCAQMIDRLAAVGVDEIGCLIDFGPAADAVLASLRLLDTLRLRRAKESPGARQRAKESESARRRAAEIGAGGGNGGTEAHGADTAAGAGVLEQIARQGVTHLQCTPSLARLLCADGEAASTLGRLSALLVGGEALPPALAGRLAALVPELHNMYGPTETTIWSATAPVGQAPERVTIGRPIAGTAIYLCSPGGAPVPVGVAGELLIGGDGVARGYLGRPELTAARFVPDSFGATPGGRLYCTGDLARHLPDGRIEFLGRGDHQVKIRGFRIEPGEIEAVFARHPAVGEAAVAVRLDATGEPRLVAYYVARDAAAPAPPAEELRGFLAAALPEPMLPAAFVQLGSLPLTANGKIDRAALPEPRAERPELATTFAAPQGPVQEMLAHLWGELLGLERIGAGDSFFALGGHSILATQLLARLRETFHVDLPLRAVFEAPTVAGLAQRIEQAGRAARGIRVPAVERVASREHYPLSFAQQRIWVLDQLSAGMTAYNDRAAFTLRGALDVGALARAVVAVVRRHDSLRTRFFAVDGRAVQAIAAEPRVALGVVDLEHLAEARRLSTAMWLAGQAAQRPFDLTAGSLLRIGLARLAPAEHVLFLAVHHIVWDGWSLGIFLRELLALYSAFAAGLPSPLAELPVRYVDLAEWQRRWLSGEVLERQLAYWQRQLGGATPALELSTDRPRGRVRGYHGRRLSRPLPGDAAAALRALGRHHGATLFMTLVAGFKVLMSHYMGGHDIVVGTDVANRDRVESEALIGFFVNQLVLRTDLSGDPSFGELLARVRETCLEAYAHQEVPFERVVDALQWDRTRGQTPLFQVKFVLQNLPLPRLEPAGLALAALDAGWETAKFDLLLNMVDTGDDLEGIWEYSTELFEEATVALMAERFAKLLRAAAARPQARLSELVGGLLEHERQVRAEERREHEKRNLARLAATRRKALGVPSAPGA
ncbi:MAG TPA: amino acid adenylation domain-containing protein [Thermoanaerobaculia bacterium]|nr:amino acid adenylation domain-containing protein [Thermoanaerobaculia bacterium]